MPVSNKVVVSNIFWRYAERMLARGMTFFVTLALARILDPKEYGLIAIVTVVIDIFETFSSRGFVQALIQKKEIDSLDYSTVFYTNMTIEIIFYLALFLGAPWFASFYNNNSLIAIMRVLGIRLIINAFNSVQQAYIQRNMQFKKFFYSTSIGTAISGIVGIIMALKNFGVWALVAQSLINPIIDTFVLFITIDWKPKLEFSILRLKRMFSYGIKMLVTGCLEAFYNELRSLVIGKVYNVSDLAFYNKGQNLPAFVVTNLHTSISNVFFAALSREDSYESTKAKMRAYLRTVFFFMSPMLVGLAVTAYPLIVLLFTEKWIASVPYVIIYSISYLTWIPQMTWLQAINSRGHAGKTLRLMIIHRFVGISLIVLLLTKGPIFIALSALLADCFITLLIFLTIRKMFNYTFDELYSDIFKIIIQTLLMANAILACCQFVDGYIEQLVLSIIIGVISYLVLSFIFKPDGYLVLCKIITNQFKKKEKTDAI